MSIFVDLYKAVSEGNQEKILKILHKEKNINLKIVDQHGDTLLHLAFKSKKFKREKQLIKILEIFLDHGADIDEKNNEDKTILHFAVERRMTNIIDMCVRRNADLNIKDNDGNSIGHFVVEEESKKFRAAMGDRLTTNNTELFEQESSIFVDFMVSRGFDFFYAKNQQGFTPLYCANETGLWHILLTLLDRITNFHAAEEDQKPLISAFFKNYNELTFCLSHFRYNRELSLEYTSRYAHNIVKIILKKSEYVDDKTLDFILRSIILKHVHTISDIEVKNIVLMILDRITNVNLHEKHEKSLTEIFVGSLFNYGILTFEDKLAVLRILISKGADVNERIRNERTLAEKLFSFYPSVEILKILKEAGMDFNAKWSSRGTFLHVVAECGLRTGLVAFVMKNSNCDVNVTNSNGETPLTLAIIHQNESMAKELIEHNADLEYRDEDGKTLLHLAVERPSEVLVYLLAKNKIDVNVKDKSGRTALHLAMSIQMVKILVRFGAHIDAIDNKGNTPLYNHAVCKQTSESIVIELLKCGADIKFPKVFQLAFDVFGESYKHNMKNTFLYLTHLRRHLFKMAAVGLLDKMPCIPCGFEASVQTFLKECQTEVELLKTYFVDEYTSLYKLLHRNRNRWCAYLDNEKLQNFVEDKDNEDKFQKYHILIVGCYNEAVRRKPLLEKFINDFNKLINANLPSECIDQIISHLSNMDLIHFIEAIKNVTHQAD